MNYKLLGFFMVIISLSIAILASISEVKIKTDCVDGQNSEIKNLPEGAYCEKSSFTGNVTLDTIIATIVILLTFIGLILLIFSEVLL